jgi:hypothetical protein
MFLSRKASTICKLNFLNLHPTVINVQYEYWKTYKYKWFFFNINVAGNFLFQKVHIKLSKTSKTSNVFVKNVNDIF